MSDRTPQTTNPKTYTAKDMAEFNRLTWLVSSPDQLKRIAGRSKMAEFVKAHGKDKCDEMWKVIKNG